MRILGIEVRDDVPASSIVVPNYKTRIMQETFCERLRREQAGIEFWLARSLDIQD